MTTFEFPLRVGSDGSKLPPLGIDPYTLPWVEGAADTVPKVTRDKYVKQVNALRKAVAARRLKQKEKA